MFFILLKLVKINSKHCRSGWYLQVHQPIARNYYPVSSKGMYIYLFDHCFIVVWSGVITFGISFFREMPIKGVVTPRIRLAREPNQTVMGPKWI